MDWVSPRKDAQRAALKVLVAARRDYLQSRKEYRFRRAAHEASARAYLKAWRWKELPGGWVSEHILGVFTLRDAVRAQLKEDPRATKKS